MNTKTPKKIGNESTIDLSGHREKLAAIHSHRKTPSLRLKESLAHSSMFQDQPLMTSRKDPLVSWNVFKTPQRAPHDLSDLQASHIIFKTPNTTKHSRSNSTLQQSNIMLKESAVAMTKKPSMIQPSPKRANEKIAALKELYQVPPSPQQLKKSPQASIARKSSCSLIPSDFMSPKNEKDQRESIDNLLSSLKGVVFSDTKNRLSKYQRRFAELNGDSIRSPGETISTPKVLHKREDGTPKNIHKREDGTPKNLVIKKQGSKQSQLLAEALSQCLPIKSPSRGASRAGTPGQVSPRDEKDVTDREKLTHNLAQSLAQGLAKQHKRGMSWGQTPMLLMESPVVKLTQEDFAIRQQEREKEERLRAAEEEHEQLSKFLCIDQQHFDFEKMMIMRREAKNSQKSVAAGSVGDVDARDKEIMLRSMFAYYSKESEKPASTGESSSKNQQGSTTCNSSKLASEVLELKKEKKKKGQEEDRDLEQLLEMIENNQKGSKRRSFKHDEF